MPAFRVPDPILPLSPSTALSPLDGRYGQQTAALRDVFSEFAFMRARLRVEVEWLIRLSMVGLPEMQPLPLAALERLRSLVRDFSLDDFENIKAIEGRTNHDVKAVEYWIKDSTHGIPELQSAAEFVHFACTSEDINNTAHGLMLTRGREVLLASLRALHERLRGLAHAQAATPMLSRTHGQAATPTTVGKEFASFAVRLGAAIETIARVPLRAKMNGAVGNYNAHRVAAPSVDWEKFARGVVEHLGLVFNEHTTQIEPHDYVAELCDAFARANAIVLDLDRDLWGYIALGYFKQRLKEGEIGSSTMPHKVNPIDFENSEGNLGVANALLHHFSEKLPVSRWQRDLSDSTVLRNLGVAFGHCVVAYEACRRGLDKLEVNEPALAADLADAWEVLAEAVQTVMRRYGVPEPYERLKELTRGKAVTRDTLHAFVSALPLPESERNALLRLTPATYVGKAEDLARRC
jgi:adenylosuccinate lyase